MKAGKIPAFISSILVSVLIGSCLYCSHTCHNRGTKRKSFELLSCGSAAIPVKMIVDQLSTLNVRGSRDIRSQRHDLNFEMAQK
jgi:hypothetical protein